MFANLISRIRRNHGLEHATIHVLSEKHSNFSAQGNSDHRGFHLNIYGDVAEGEVMDAVEEAFRRMKRGEHHLAVHPNCGTVLITTATMAAIAGQLAFLLERLRRRQKTMTVPLFLNALPTAVLSVVVALIVSKPLGIYLQAEYTTEGDLGEMELQRIEKISPTIITRIFQLLLTGGSKQLKATSYKIETVN